MAKKKCYLHVGVFLVLSSYYTTDMPYTFLLECGGGEVEERSPVFVSVAICLLGLVLLPTRQLPSRFSARQWSLACGCFHSRPMLPLPAAALCLLYRRRMPPHYEASLLGVSCQCLSTYASPYMAPLDLNSICPCLRDSESWTRCCQYVLPKL